MTTVDLEQTLELHALVHVEDAFFVALVVRLLLRRLLHVVDLGVALRQNLVGKVQLRLQLLRVVRSMLLLQFLVILAVSLRVLIFFFEQSRDKPVFDTQLFFVLLNCCLQGQDRVGMLTALGVAVQRGLAGIVLSKSPALAALGQDFASRALIVKARLQV